MISAGRFGRDDGFVLDSGWDFVALLIRAAEHLQLLGIVNRSDQPVQAEGSVRCAKA
jgi:hypothetical protein